MHVTEEDHKAVAAAIREAEQRSSGQLICVLARSSSSYAHVPILWAIALALFLPWPLIYLTELSVQRIFLMQLVLFIVAGVALSWMPLRLALVPRPVLRARARRAAVEQFALRHVSHAANRSRVLIFVSLAERHAHIIADEDMVAKVPIAEWQAAVDSLTAHMRAGRIAAGFIAAIEHCGAVLAVHAPPDDSPMLLTNRLYVI